MYVSKIKNNVSSSVTVQQVGLLEARQHCKIDKKKQQIDYISFQINSMARLL